jgi:hypothetical protein
MVFFDPTLRHVFGGELPVATEILADDIGIEQLIERLQDPGRRDLLGRLRADRDHRAG